MRVRDASIGMTIGALTILSFQGRNRHGQALVECACVCGTTCIALVASLGRHQRSCGCLSPVKRTHGMAGSAEYRIWRGMIQRCTNPKRNCFARYGGRGIGVCDEWRSFEQFFRDMGPKPSPGHTLERIDNSRGYEASNCRWATRAEQALNTSRTVVLTFGGRTAPLSVWSRETGIPYETIRHRLQKQGLPPDRVLERCPF